MRFLAAAVNPTPLWVQACVHHLPAALGTASEREGRATPMTVSPAALRAIRLILALTSGCSQGVGWRGLCVCPVLNSGPGNPAGGPDGWPSLPPNKQSSSAQQALLILPPHPPLSPHLGHALSPPGADLAHFGVNSQSLGSLTNQVRLVHSQLPSLCSPMQSRHATPSMTTKIWCFQQPQNHVLKSQFVAQIRYHPLHEVDPRLSQS